MDDKKFNFIKSALDGLSVPAKGEQRVYYYDTRIRALALCVTPTGAKTFYVVRRVDGKPERIRLGPYPDLSIEQARKMADERNGDIARGENPNKKRRAARAEMTFGELFEQFMELHAKPHKKSWKEDEGQFDRHLGAWKAMKVSAISKANVRALHAKVKDDAERKERERVEAKSKAQAEGADAEVTPMEDVTVPEGRGIYAANRVLALVRSVFNWANDNEVLARDNPAQGVKPFKEHSRDRRLFGDELPAFFAAVAEEPNTNIRDYILLSLLTGARRSNVVSMRWDQLSLERATWAIPMTKNGTSQIVPLTAAALEILRQRQAEVTGPFVFPGDSKSGHLEEPRKGWERIVERAGLKDLRLHDLRRTLGSWQVDTGATLAMVGRTLNHKSPQTTAIYARLDVDPVRQSMERATEAMFSAGGIKTGNGSVASEEPSR